MKIGILQTGKLPPDLATRFRQYPEMFRDLLTRADPTLTFEDWAVVDGVIPRDPQLCDAWLITGSRFGVYDPEPWIGPLKEFLRDVRAAGIPLIGVCFGHQIMAEAFGGRAVKSDKGWGGGVHHYAVSQRPGWMGEGASEFTMYAMHQDQVVALPEDATVLAGSTFCPAALVAYGNAEAPEAISIQPHPEFPDDFARALVEVRGEVMGVERAAEAAASFGPSVDRDAFARWALDYLATARKSVRGDR